MVRVLQFCARDVTVQKLLLPLIDRLTGDGFEVVSACTPGRYTPDLIEQGYALRAVEVDRRFSPRSNAKSVWDLYRLLRREHFDVVHVHTPVAAAVGRVAAKMAGVPIILYTAHGFYHHENMRWRTRQACVWAERILGKATHTLMTQSQEDAASAVSEGIRPADRVVWIGNGVDISQFQPGPASAKDKQSFGIPGSAPVAGFMGPIIAEKGALELVDAFAQTVKSVPDAYLLLAGDVINGDRDLHTKEVIRQKLEGNKLSSRIIFAGYQEDISSFMRAIDLFALPSHREGMPRSIIEAMASGKPVVATDIRGCREEVIHDLTGLIVPLRDSQALSQAMTKILSDPALARRMGDEGRQRAEDLYDEKDVLDREVQVYRKLVKEKLHQDAFTASPTQARTPQREEPGIAKP
ncbi:MAG: glycosyltransferase family 4 protein [Chloroflexi bacterium]|nr:glycosyltransferase family 4 protein [Chloroflexota bacterium]MDA1219526.1 glycosyltransferase family 4 protein [Chloroflexota bacterium]